MLSFNKEQQVAEQELPDLINTPVKVKAFGREHEVRRFPLGKMQRAVEHIAPLGYLMRSASQGDIIETLVQALAMGGPPAIGLLSVQTEEPPEWLEDKDPIEGVELLAAIVEVNARYFFDSENLERLKRAGARIQKVIETYGGATSANSSSTSISTET
jgi:hypothetical protein